MTAFCSSCNKECYIDDGNTPVCPVCSSPLTSVETEQRTSTSAPLTRLGDGWMGNVGESTETSPAKRGGWFVVRLGAADPVDLR